MAFASPELDAIILAAGGAIPTVALWTEIRDLLQDTYGSVVGSETLPGVTGVNVTIADIGTVDYDIFGFVESGGTVGTIGEITATPVNSTTFRLVNSGSNTTATFKYRIIKR
jgi:hypothetical protein